MSRPRINSQLAARRSRQPVLQQNAYLYGMPTLTIKVPESERERLAEFVASIGGEVVSVRETRAEMKARVLAELKEGLDEVEAIRTGKQQPLSMTDLFDGD